ncbi:MAG: hypothetical protein A3J88_00170 [Melioribacter sp. RIFOXYB12_FULL_38_5]|nr:MAG: hypothetical protein A3J88_00170 [Melioribacter sp. RIFOXYB12_FULL_38_5]
MAAESIERFRGNEREISSTTVALSSEKFLQIQQMIRDFRKQVLAVAEGDGAREKIYQLNFQLYPLTEIIDDGEK